MTRTAPGEPNYQASPEIRSVVAAALGGTTVVEHSVSDGPQSLGRSSGLPGQSFSLRHAPVLPRRSEERLRISFQNVVEDWEEVDNFADSGPEDRHFVLDGPSGTIHLGPVSATQMAAGGSKGQPPRPALRSK